MAAGGSALERARRARERAVTLARRAREAHELAGRFQAAAEAERRAAAALIALTSEGWQLLVDRQWPGTRSGNIDMIMTGPGGVFVIDVKNWRDAPEVIDGRLVAGGADRHGEIGKLLAMTCTAEHALEDLGVTPITIHPLMVFAGHRTDERVGRVRLLGVPDTATALLAEPQRLRPALVRVVANHLEQVFPAYDTPALDERDSAAGSRAGTMLDGEPSTQDDTPPEGPGGTTRTVGAAPGDGEDALFDVRDLEMAALAAAHAAPIEGWMTFLHPSQVLLVRRDFNGPARIGGPAGTGKTVVGLHRAAYLAQRSAGKVLYVTFVNNLPRVQAEFLRRMAPAVANRVVFTSLHSWANTLLDQRGIEVHLNGDRAETAFNLAWYRVGSRSVLADVEPHPAYWREEIDYVIKGRGLTRFTDYQALVRRSRGTRLQLDHRKAVWELYEDYQRLCRERRVHDFNDVLHLALEEISHTPVRPAYSAVIADEVQDLTLVGVRLLHALVGDARNGLLLIGDGQQAVYPGGFRLTDANINIKGARSEILRTNYRNAAEILDTALAVVATDTFDDVDGETHAGQRDVELTHHGGNVIRVDAKDQTAHDATLINTINKLARETARNAASNAAGNGTAEAASALAGMAVLCARRREVGHYHAILTRAHIPVLRLEDYDGRSADAVKLGTYRRAKGLEFKCVFLPGYHAALPPATAEAGTRAADQERQALARRQLFVAMTRARDTLWLGSWNSSHAD